MELVKSEVPYIKTELGNIQFIIEGDENGKIGLGVLRELLRQFFHSAYDITTDWRYEGVEWSDDDSCSIDTEIEGELFMIRSDKEGKTKVNTVARKLSRFVKSVFNDDLEWGEYSPPIDEKETNTETDRGEERFRRETEYFRKERERKESKPPVKKYDVVNIPTDEEASRYTYYISEQREKGKIIDNESCYLDKCLVDVLCRIREACRREERSIEVSTDEITQGAIKAFEDAGYGITRWSLLGKDDNFVTISWGRWL